MTKLEVRTRIEEIGVLPAIRVASQEDAIFAAETVYRAGITVAEVTMTVPGGIEVISSSHTVCRIWWWARELSWMSKQRGGVWMRGQSS